MVKVAMCGYLGIFAPHQNPFRESESLAFRKNAERLSHRGNSSKGEQLSKSAQLFHHRLAFRGISDGQQPMTDSQNRATILFNGELYDFHRTRAILAKSYEFKSHSDTEVLLAGILAYGSSFLKEIDGEYSALILDHRDHSITALRDPFGVKPIFFMASSGQEIPSLHAFQKSYELNLSGRIAFSSEIKGLPFPLSWNQRGWERNFFSLYEEMGTAYQGVYALAPGSFLCLKLEETGFRGTLERIQTPSRQIQKHGVDFSAAAERVKKAVQENVRKKLDSEVPLGVYLSGGVDSRIVAHEVAQSQGKVDTFTVGFEGIDYDESPEVRSFLRENPSLTGRLLITSNEALAYAYPNAVYASELVQPYTNGSAKWWLSRFARKYVRGVLTGDGADEFFCGYPSFQYLAWWKFFQNDPSSNARKNIYLRRVVGLENKFWEKGISSESSGADLQSSLKTLGWAHPLFSQISYLSEFVLGKNGAQFLNQEKAKISSYVDLKTSPLCTWQNYFLRTHFPTHVLNWVGDRMEMANTLEGRPVFVGRDLFQTIAEVPDHFLVRGLTSKAILRKAFASDLRSFSRIKKKQFNAPFLFDSPLGREFLSEKSIKNTALIDPALVQKAKTLRQNPSLDPLQKSFVDIFLQNALVTQLLDHSLVRGNGWTRDLEFEESFLEKNTVQL